MTPKKFNKNILVTGSAGFIGFHICEKLLELSLKSDFVNYKIIGLDNFNEYYDVRLKVARNKILKKFKNFECFEGNITNQKIYNKIFNKYKIDYVIHLAAYAGVRHSFKDPYSYIDTNIMGFTRLLENCQKEKIKHLVYASSSSVYGSNKDFPFSTDQKVDTPVSLYAASKKSNELIAYSYAHNYNLPCTGLRYFTVYGPWGRPDMALFLFTKAILENKEIKVFNYGNMKRDFTYIDDIVEGTLKVLWAKPEEKVPFKVYNIGSGKTISLNYFIDLIEKNLKKETKRKLLPIPPGDVPETYSDISDLKNDVGYEPKVLVEEGIKNFIDWYKNYYKGE